MSGADGPFVQVAINTPLRQLFDYLPLEGPVQTPAGSRVWVPFGRRRLVGVVMGARHDSLVPAAKLRHMAQLIDAVPLFDPALLAFLQWSADYYHHPVGEVVAAALPRLLRDGASTQAMSEYWGATSQGLAALAAGEPRRAARQRELLQCLAAGRALSALDLAERMPNWRTAARSLQQRGFIVSQLLPDATPAVTSHPAACAPTLTLGVEQQAAFAAIRAGLGSFGSYLLDGITGSGKTEIYLRLIDEVLAHGRSALVLVPEIGLTPQLLGRFRARFDVALTVLHSALTDRERLTAWRDAWSGRARIVLGTRSAVFAPLTNLGLIVVDEEHDTSYKQHEGGFLYSARDLAIVRAQQFGVPIVLGSATPAFESLHNVETGKSQRLSLPRRAAAASPPRLALIDLRAHNPHRGLSTPLVQAMQRHLEDRGQVLVFINRRGYAPTLLCTGCGWIAPCSQCDARMTVHRASEQLACHHCGAQVPLPSRCPRCGHKLRPVGQGTERVEETLGELFPAEPLVRFDRDSVRNPADLDRVLERVVCGEARILVGTQMLTKGHHFPDVTLVAILNADHSLFSADFRAPERLAQTIVQVAGRAGRATRAGEVLIQTEYPQHPLLQSLLSGGYDGFARIALAERADAQWPPYSRLAVLRSSNTEAGGPIDFLAQARRLLSPPPGLQLRGPVPAAMRRRAGRYHAQLILESADRQALHRYIAQWLPLVEALPAARALRWALDVDPLDVL